VLDSDDISWGGVPDLTDAITREIPSTRASNVEGNEYQPDIIYHGFIASPVAGTAEGLAVYVNGARFNDPFGDTVNWDLIPAVAIQSVTVQSSNPLFGLNALGGSVNVQLKNGFNFHGGDFSNYGGLLRHLRIKSGVRQAGRRFRGLWGGRIHPRPRISTDGQFAN
jgi:iron complex outermembrane recepter protein